ncbi:MAG: amidohydrolase [Actinomycetota bacterium]
MTSTLFTGGRIIIPGGDHASWVVVGGDTIAGVGTGEPPRTDRVVDMQGATLVPAFRDAHAHLPATGLYRAGMNFRGERRASAILDAFSERASSGELLFGGNFEDPLDRSLTGSDLDRVVGDRPALLVRADMHSLIASSALMRQLDVSGLEGVDRADDGTLTGYLREEAAGVAYRWFDQNLPKEQQQAAVRSAIELAYSKGIAEVHEMHVVEWRGWEAWDTLADAISDVALTVVPYIATSEVDRVIEMGFRRIGGDYFLDGSFGSHTAWMKEPFLSPPPEGSPACGIAYRSDDDLFEFFYEAQTKGLQVGVHAIGDAAIEQALVAWERVASKVGTEEVWQRGHRIEHFECGSDDHIARSVALGLTLSVQPAFDNYWGGPDGLYAERIGWDRARNMNRFRSMHEAGLVMAAGSDSTVTSMDPFLQMHSLRDHHLPEERCDRETALSMNTLGPVLAAGGPVDRGTIEVGLRADLALCDRDPLEVDDAELLETEVVGTWCAGARVWPLAEAETA